ncbi:MAG: DUF6781 family protein [Planctomycetota bacterium]
MQTEEITRRIHEVVRAGGDVKGEAEKLIVWATEYAAESSASARARLDRVVGDIVNSAATAVDGFTPDEATSTLRQVIDGVGEGLGRTAQATSLAVEEAASNGRAYAEHDLKGVAEDLSAIASMFGETVERGVSGLMNQGVEQASALREHAERTIGGVKPAIEGALRAAAGDPAGLAGEAAKAATDATREAAGALFSAMGRLLSDAGDRVKPERRE